MSATIRLKKFGTKKRPFYRIIVIDSHSARDARALDEVGYYHPIETEDKQVLLDKEKIVKWLKVGVRPSDTVRKLFNKNNIKLGELDAVN